MGNENQPKQQNGEVTLNINHPKFQKAKLVNEGKQRRLQFTIGVDQQEYQKWRHNLDLNHLSPTYLLLPTNDSFSRKGLCGDTGTLQLSFENYPYLLSEEIYNRRGRHSKFEETELWYLLFVLCAAQQEVKRKTGSKVGDIRPQNVFLNSQGEAKVCCTLSWPREGTNFSKTFDNEATYLAPQDMERLQMGTLEDSHSHQGQIFSIGLTVLSAAMLEDFLHLYNTKTYRFDAQQFAALLNEFKGNTIYSEIFTALLSNLCKLEPQRRIEGEQLWKWLWQFEADIRRKQDFLIEYAPPIIDQQVEEIRQMFPVEVQEVPEQHIYPPPGYQHPHYAQQLHPVPQQHPAQTGFPDRSVVETYQLPPQVQSPRGIIQGHQTLPPQVLYQNREVASPRGQIPTNARLTQQAYNRPQPPQIQDFQPQTHQYRASQDAYHGYVPQQLRANQQIQMVPRSSAPVQPRSPQPPQRFVNYEGARNDEIQKRYVIADSPPQQASRKIYGQEYAGGQVTQGQLPPQLVGRTVRETYIGQGGQSRTIHQGYIPSFGPEQPGQRAQGSSMNYPNNLSYFQNVIDPQGARGGRIEETVYIQRPSDYSNIGRPQ